VKEDWNVKQIIHETGLFSNISKNEFERIYEQLNLIEVFAGRGEVLDGTHKHQNVIGIVIYGELHAMKYSISGKSMFLKEICKGDIFGLGSVFTNEDTQLSYMEVMNKSKIAYINESELMKLFQNEQILRNYLFITSSKIKYLNQKIDIISQASGRDRLLAYIYDQWRLQNNENIVRLTMSKSDLADYLGISRASLYRIIDRLSAEEILYLKNNSLVFNENKIKKERLFND